MKKFLAIILALCLVMGLTVTATAADTDKAIMLGTSGISPWNATDGYDYIYMGSYDNSPIKWRVLDTKTNTGENGLFVLSESLLGAGEEGDVYFQQHIHNDGGASYYKGDSHQDGTELIANGYQGSDAQSWCNTFETTNLSRTELSAIIATTKSDEEFISTASYSYEIPFAASDDILNGDKVFFLSAEETENSNYGFVDDSARVAYYGENAGVWWLRSPYELLDRSAGCIGGTDWEGYVAFGFVKTSYAARPAFNLDTSKVLFTSAATNGKTVGALGTLTAPAAYSGNEWKLTLKDSSHTLTSATTSSELTAGGTISVSYTGASTNHTLSAVVVKKDTSEVLYYGKLVDSIAAADGTVKLTLPSEFDSTAMTVKLFAETLNGNNKTDYASELVELAVHAHTWNTAWASNETHHWHEPTCGCTIADNTQKDGYATHTAPADDGNCMSAVTCPTCQYVLTAAKSAHTPGADDDDCTTAVLCANAGCTQVAVAPQAAHDFTGGTVYKQEADGHSKQCANCAVYDAREEHSSTGDKAATYKKKAVCDICGAEYGELKKRPSRPTNGQDVVKSPATFDAGFAVYGVMALSSALGAVYVGKKK